MKNKTIVESTTPPSNTNTLWLDMSDKNKSLKVFNNGKWEEINNTTSRISDVVNTSEEAINLALMDSLSYGIRWKSGDVSTVVRVGNDTIRRDNPIMTTEIISAYDSYVPNKLVFPQFVYLDAGEITCELNYSNLSEALKDYYFPANKTVQLLTRDGKVYIKDYIKTPTDSRFFNIVDPITEGTKEQNSVYEIYILGNYLYLGEVTIDTDGTPMAKVTYQTDDNKEIPEGVYQCYVCTYTVRPTNLTWNFFSHLILCPQFYIKSFEDNGYKEIRISRYKIDDTWTELKRCTINPTIFPYDNGRGGVTLSSKIKNIEDINYMPMTDLFPLINFLDKTSMNYCEFSRIFLCLLFINAAKISAYAFYEPLSLGNQVILSGIYVSAYDVKVVERDGTSKFLPKSQGPALYDDSKTNYFKDFFLIDNGVLIPTSDGGTKNNCIGSIENDGKARIQQNSDDKSTAFTILKANDVVKFLFSNLDYSIQYTSESNILKESIGTGLIRIFYN